MSWRAAFRTWIYSRAGVVAVVIVGEILTALLIFHAGVVAGERSTLYRIHGPAHPSQGSFLPHGFIPEGHGAVGTITKVASSSITLRTRDGEDETVTISSSTIIRGSGASNLQVEALSAGQAITVLGDPDDTDADGLEARYIRILAAPPADTSLQ